VRDCHIEPDWLLLYEKSGDLKTGELRLIRTGTHSELF
jgi:mRNA interferase YafQ